ncbi:hypothetical protein P2J95_13050 [Mannheimia haemolytica]|nr:hypothetical protein [Mannheimia haemolytica]
MKLMKDMGTQSYIWSGFSTWLAWLGEQQNLMLLSLAIGIVTAIAGLIQRRSLAVKRLTQIVFILTKKLLSVGQKI